MQENLSLYHIFYTVSRTGNISSAAKELYISQPAISRAIKKLENNLDTTLFKRSSRGVALTPDGRILYEKVKGAFDLLSEGEDSILHNRSREIPRLRIGASTTLCKYVLMPRLKDFIAANPQIRITISCQSTYQTLKLLEEDKIDIGLIGRHRNYPDTNFRLCCRSRIPLSLHTNTWRISTSFFHQNPFSTLLLSCFLTNRI